MEFEFDFDTWFLWTSLADDVFYIATTAVSYTEDWQAKAQMGILMKLSIYLDRLYDLIEEQDRRIDGYM